MSADGQDSSSARAPAPGGCGSRGDDRARSPRSPRHDQKQQRDPQDVIRPAIGVDEELDDQRHEQKPEREERRR